MTGLAILIPAAGRSERMDGRDKLLEPVDGEPLLARQARAALATGWEVLITLPPGAAARRTALDGIGGACLRDVTDAAQGMAASIRAGALWAEAREADGLLVLLADLPELGTDDIAAVARSFIARPRLVHRGMDSAGRKGHPVVLPRRLFPMLGALEGDAGAQQVFTGETVVKVPLPGHRATTDLDTPADWAAWRQRTGR
ncbi:nucleotidyltransferase family protein [Roseovarius sp. TE539]|uniref:nucleotidyltransferase family protein n=1 Tax=Roseovarius sp. TE539 TaxID=2249812 RepID=UPI000DE123E4|nr:nucleotidyltransferase family protein [Roseovarius sp. TE539]RBI70553.1 nucleotidyltransferase family protein [Roseovarius sp. TE539]